ncbi:MAG: EAL domain-containing protein [Betaproteobacteria bacterium]|nr:EAL domain-containing protein [Betaproteobacteria bacterium]
MNALLTFFRSPWVRLALVLLAAGALGAALVVTIYLTIVDLQWLAFLGGVLFAALLAMASQASRAEWTIARRTRQLERAREQLTQEVARSRNAAEAMRISEARMRMLSDALPSLIFFVDRDERCRYHNVAAGRKTGLAADRINGHPLRDVVGNDVYLNIAPHIAEALSGSVVDYELAWDSANAPDLVYAARHVPYPADEAQPRGFYLLLTRAALQPAARASAAAPAPAAEHATEAGDAFLVHGEGGEMLYLRSMTDELMGWGDPRAKLVRALAENQFLLFAQKILSLKSGVPDCYEILLRLKEEEDNLLPPGGFIPVAERYGMMEELDRWVVRNLVTWCLEQRRSDSDWRAPLYCVNLSGAALRNPEFARFVLRELQRPGFDPRSLGFEIGEQDVINQRASAQDFMTALKPTGCRFTVDAFGGVKVSFSYLKGLAVDFLKIDGIIIQNLLRDPAELAKTKAINTVCQKIGVRTIAEFVETQETLDKLREIGVGYVQGFGIARPGPIAQQG